MAPSPSMPLELWEQIIDCLSDDKTTLKSCSLTCQSWLPRTRYHTFSRVSIHSSNCAAFTKLLESSSDVGSFIESLTIVGNFPWTGVHEPLHQWLKSMPAWVPSRLPRIRHLEMLQVSIDKKISSSFLELLRTVTSLSLLFCHISGADLLIRLILAYPELKDLRLILNSYHDNRSYFSPAKRAGPSKILRMITLSGTEATDIVLAWLASEELQFTTRALVCVHMDRKSLGSLVAAMPRLTKDLEELKLRGIDMHAAAEMPYPYQLTPFHFSKLAMLSLEIRFTQPLAARIQLDILRNIESPELALLRFDIRSPDCDSFMTLPWETMTGSLSRSHFPSLKTLQIRFAPDTILSEDETARMQNFVRTVFRNTPIYGLLQFLP